MPPQVAHFRNPYLNSPTFLPRPQIRTTCRCTHRWPFCKAACPNISYYTNDNDYPASTRLENWSKKSISTPFFDWLPYLQFNAGCYLLLSNCFRHVYETHCRVRLSSHTCNNDKTRKNVQKSTFFMFFESKKKSIELYCLWFLIHTTRHSWSPDAVTSLSCRVVWVRT